MPANASPSSVLDTRRLRSRALVLLIGVLLAAPAVIKCLIKQWWIALSPGERPEKSYEWSFTAEPPDAVSFSWILAKERISGVSLPELGGLRARNRELRPAMAVWRRVLSR
jgi:hypothetical protein